MKARNFTVGAAALAVFFTLGWVLPGEAQERRPPASSGSSGSSGGQAVPRTSSGGGGGGGGGGAASGVAVPRGSGGGGGGGSTYSPPATGAWGGGNRGAVTRPGSSRGRVVDGSGSAVPIQSRPRAGRPAVGEAVRRDGPPPVPGGGGGGYYYPNYYYPSYYYDYWPYGYGYGAFGLGYFYYDPYWWGGYPGYGYGRGYGYYADASPDYYFGSVRLKVKPKQAEVFVDGYYAGQVDDFDGIFQSLDIETGPHRVEIRAVGFEPLVFEVRVQPGRTITYHGDMRPSL